MGKGREAQQVKAKSDGTVLTFLTQKKKKKKYEH